MPPSIFVESLYEKLTDEEDARVCKDIPENACRETPGNFFLILIAHFLTKLGDAIANPKLTLAWVMTTVQAPVYLTGFLVPIRESGSMLPQLVIASYVRRRPFRKWVWVNGSILQAATIAAVGVTAITLSGAVAGWALLALLALFSLSRGLCSVASKDVLGKTIPKTRRGRLTGWSASAAGLATIGLGVMLLTIDVGTATATLYGTLIAGAGVLWLLAALTYSQVREFAGATEGGGNALDEALERLTILRTDHAFRHFVITRALLLCSALTAPYYVILAQEHLGSPAYLLGLFVIASGLASLLSAPVWGRAADRSSRQVMISAAVLTALVGICVFLVDQLAVSLLANAWFLPLAYLLLSVAHDGVRVGRKTYVVDLAGGNRRTDYVAVSNTVIGVILLVAGLAGALATVIPVSGIILLLSLAGLGGAAMAKTLPEVE